MGAADPDDGEGEYRAEGMLVPEDMNRMMYITVSNHTAQPKMFTMQVMFLLSHLMVTEPSISWSQ